MRILNTLIPVCDKYDYDDLYCDASEKREKILERAYEIGMSDFVFAYFRCRLIREYEDSPDDDEMDLDYLQEIMDAADLENIANIAFYLDRCVALHPVIRGLRKQSIVMLADALYETEISDEKSIGTALFALRQLFAVDVPKAKRAVPALRRKLESLHDVDFRTRALEELSHICAHH